MTQNQIKLKTFVTFLKKESAYEDYIQLVCADESQRFRASFLRSIEDPLMFIVKTTNSSPNFLISKAFNWMRYGDEDCNRWYKLHEKWIVMCNMWNGNDIY